MTTTDNAWVLITGASSGFGAEFARQYAERGHSLVLVARRLERLQALADTLRQQYRIEVVVEHVDLADIASVIELHQRLRERGMAIDILINNAGHGLQGTFVDGTRDAALAMLQLDVVSLTAITHVFAQDMRARGRGKILLVASLLAYQGVEKFAVYAAAKAYVLRLGEALHRELKRDGVTVTVLSPGMSDTGFATGAQQTITPALRRMMMQPAPVVRAGIRALQAGRISVVPGWANKAAVIFVWSTPRWLHQAIFARIMNGCPTGPAMLSRERNLGCRRRCVPACRDNGCCHRHRGTPGSHQLRERMVSVRSGPRTPTWHSREQLPPPARDETRHDRTSSAFRYLEASSEANAGMVSPKGIEPSLRPRL